MTATAFFWGIISAISLPAGALLGLWWRPGSRVTSAMMAFGAGALLFALTIELMGHVPHYVEVHGNLTLGVALGAALCGGLLFDVLNQYLNNRGAFLRNLSNARDFVARTKRARARRWARRLTHMDILRDLPPKDLAELVKHVRKEVYQDGKVIFRQGEEARELHFVRRGQVRICNLDEQARQSDPATEFGRNDTFGERAVFADGSRHSTAVAVGLTVLYTLDESDLDMLLAQRPEIATIVERLTSWSTPANQPGDAPQTGGESTDDHLERVNVSVSDQEVHEESRGAAKGAGAAMAIWLGIAIDGVPESVVIGTLAIGKEGMSMAFIAGVFLANVPESMSSAVSMRRNGMSTRRIMLMWSSLCLLTGLGAALGAAVFPPDPTGMFFYVKLGIEGLAAGAMLTMVAETMLPEAFEQGGSIIGIATLCGFLAALAIAALA